MLSDEWLQRYRLLENFTAKWNGNGNGKAYDRGDYNSSFALRAVELKSVILTVSKKKYSYLLTKPGNYGLVNRKANILLSLKQFLSLIHALLFLSIVSAITLFIQGFLYE